MWASLLLGLTASFGHCVGMCSGVALLLGRRGRWGWLLAHSGRVATYTLLGALAGLLGATLNHGHEAMGEVPLARFQGGLSLAAALAVAYMAVAWMGWTRPPEHYLAPLTRRWGGALRRLRASGNERPFLLGLLWGLLPCGLVLAALMAALAHGSPAQGALAMLLFGLGTWPALLGVSWLGKQALPVARPLVAAVALLAAGQLALRGLAVWGLVGHLHLGKVMLW